MNSQRSKSKWQRPRKSQLKKQGPARERSIKASGNRVAGGVHPRVSAKKPAATPADTGRKFDGGKSAMSLHPPWALMELGKVWGFGATKYDTWNWANGIKCTRLMGAALRHIFQYLAGEDTDPETGILHPIQACASLLMWAEHYPLGLAAEFDDRLVYPQIKRAYAAMVRELEREQWDSRKTKPSKRKRIRSRR